MGLRLPCFEEDFDLFVADGFGKGHLDSVFFFSKGESTFSKEGFDVLELSVVVVFVLDLLLEGLSEFLTASVDKFD